jgi:hypothetical protein
LLYKRIPSKIQINSFYKLGRDSKDFIRYINNEELKFRDKSFFDRFVIKELVDIPLEKDERYLTYANRDSYEKLDVYEKVLNNLENKRNKSKYV